jgi:hypothetical protein
MEVAILLIPDPRDPTDDVIACPRLPRLLPIVETIADMLCESAPVITAIPLERTEIPLPKLDPRPVRAEDIEPRAFDTVD